MKKIIHLSKFLSLGLRHDDAALKVIVDEEGWAPVKDILTNNPEFTMDILEEIVSTDDKGRYSFNTDKTLIRANQGHSIPRVNINFRECIPPRFLYHGTSSNFVDSILAKGLVPMSRLYVHMSADIDTAKKVGKRHGGETVVLIIDSEGAFHYGTKFYKSDNGVWLAKKINNAFILAEKTRGLN